jgi:Fur family transcriptional regulator, ferric uptake regulator
LSSAGASTIMQTITIPIHGDSMTETGPVRMTESRAAILSALEASRSHPTADDLYEMVRASLPRISLGTVYRNLDLLARAGLIAVIVEAGSQRRYDAVLRPHHHVRCERCGRVDDVELDDTEEIQQLPARCGGYAIRGYTLCFIGVCPDCAQDGDKE